jgi:hypothetical protein
MGIQDESFSGKMKLGVDYTGVPAKAFQLMMRAQRAAGYLQAMDNGIAAREIVDDLQTSLDEAIQFHVEKTEEHHGR